MMYHHNKINDPKNEIKPVSTAPVSTVIQYFVVAH